MGMDNQQLWQFYCWSTIATSAVLVLLYSLSLHMILKDTNVGFVVAIIILLIVSNLGAIGIIYANVVLTEHNEAQTNPPTSIIYFQAVTGLMRDGCFNMAYVKFASEYYFSAVSMKYIFEQSEMPEERKQRLNIMNKVLYTANAAVPILYYFILCYTNILGGK
jgi:hypothetical protein